MTVIVRCCGVAVVVGAGGNVVASSATVSGAEPGTPAAGDSVAPGPAGATEDAGAVAGGTVSWPTSVSRPDDPVAPTVLTATSNRALDPARVIGPARRRPPWRRRRRRRQRAKAPLRIGTSTKR